jgi:glutathione synthase/RimK-type ligase-like ATP-grasp enzyme
VMGNFDTMAIEDAPAFIVETAEKATRLIGTGLYGVDIKEYDGKAMIIEVNDNPSLDYGIEDQVLGDELYARIIQSLKNRIQLRTGLIQ